jgi:hypothetical protein
VPKNNNFEGIWFDEDNDGQINPGEVWYLLAFWEVSPQNEYTHDLQSVHYSLIGQDSDPTDGWRIKSNTTQIPDGFYLLRARLYDATGNVGMNRTTLYINNNPPNPITQLSTSQITQNQATLSWSTNQDEDFKAYQIYLSQSPQTTGANIQNIYNYTTTSTTINNLNSQTTYYLTIIVQDHNNQTSTPNPQTTITTQSPTPTPTPSPSPTPTPTPTPQPTPTPTQTPSPTPSNSPQPNPQSDLSIQIAIAAIASIAIIVTAIFLIKRK